MKVFLVGEGPTDIGDLANSFQYRKDPPEDGFLQPLIRTMVQEPCEIVGQKITALRPRTVRGRKTAIKGKAEIAAAVASVDEADVLVYSMDGDNDFDRRRGDLATKLDATGASYAIAMPRTTIEAWAMADDAALRSVDDGITAPSQPENLWGKPKDPGSNHPKNYLTRLLGERPDRQLLAGIAANSLPSAMCATCPDGFRPFSNEMSENTGHLPCTP